MRRWRLFGALAAGVLLALGLIAGRIWHTGSITYAFLGWNLFLAWMPLLFAWLAERAKWGATAVVWSVLWLLFFPNAPYIVTDFVHLAPRPGVPFWYDLMLILTCALVGLLLGLASLGLIHGRAARAFGTAVGWLIVLLACGLAGVGVAIGRFLRWNSWDALLNPLALVQDLALRLPDLRLMALSGLLSVLVLLGYLVMQSLSAPDR